MGNIKPVAWTNGEVIILAKHWTADAPPENYTACYYQEPGLWGWEKIGTEPADGTQFLAYRKGIVSQCGWKSVNSELALGGPGWSYPEWDMPTHWMTLPEPPKEQS